MTKLFDVLIKRRLEDGDFDADSIARGMHELWIASDGAQREDFLELIGEEGRAEIAGTLEDWDVDTVHDDDDDDEDGDEDDDIESDEAEDDLEDEDDELDEEDVEDTVTA